ncbi:RecB family exonuclease [Kribbella sp. CA-293567]|uniref:RecB family exonuclease n=1 Tax=Kribbella sp. CA-293567 TaxID=3002436 RepID=UPI0022DDDC0A|nr:PD-(D/E)XK nuclease family protein [Kribbella sp. CA-293567]WBQ08511.1 PD-(D/E)XK nuclease family protein [Kribbella sp. CA-293567]
MSTAAMAQTSGHPIGALSPSRAADFMSCPLRYRFRVIDKLPEKPSSAAVRGTVVHAVLERLFDLPRGQRTLEHATELLEPQWLKLLEAEPEVAELFAEDADGAELAKWLQEAHQLLGKYFTLEDPNLLEPAERELYVETELESGLTLRGYVDRLDVAPTGEIRVVDYKTGRSPSEFFEAKALFQMKFYALVLWRVRGVVPAMLQLVYLGNGEIVRYVPDEADLRACERKIGAIWQAISYALESGDWRPSKSPLCNWCDHKALCPSWGGTPPPLPARSAEEVTAGSADVDLVGVDG